MARRRAESGDVLSPITRDTAGRSRLTLTPAGKRIRASDATVLDLAAQAIESGLGHELVSEIFSDVLAERALRFEHPRALRAAAAAIADGGDPVETYLDMRE